MNAARKYEYVIYKDDIYMVIEILPKFDEYVIQRASPELKLDNWQEITVHRCEITEVLRMEGEK